MIINLLNYIFIIHSLFISIKSETTGYVLDGKTPICWDNLYELIIDCPIELALDISDLSNYPDIISLNTYTRSFTVSLPQQLTLSGKSVDVFPQNGYDIYYGNWRFCRDNQFCTPFLTNSNGLVSESMGQSANTDSTDSAIFTQEFIVPENGLYQMVAHIQFFLLHEGKNETLYDAAVAISILATEELNYDNDYYDAGTSSTGLILGITIFITFVGLVIFLVCRCYRKKKQPISTPGLYPTSVYRFQNFTTNVRPVQQLPHTNILPGQHKIGSANGEYNFQNKKILKNDSFSTSPIVSKNKNSENPILTLSTHQRTSSVSNSSHDQGSISAYENVFNALNQSQRFKQTSIDPSKIHLLEIVGSGSFGEVWKGEYSGCHIAIKRIHTYMQEAGTESFVKEITLIKDLRHPNIIQFIGTSFIDGFGLTAITEYMDLGDLTTVLKDAKKYQLTWSNHKIRIALDSALGLAYLHGLNPPTMHRDLKSRNILISDQFKAKLSDFGLSRNVSTTTTMTVVGSNLWLAPEMIRGEKFSEKADIFSFGVVLCELDTEKLPYADMTNPEGLRLSGIALAHQVAYQNVRPNFTLHCLPKIKSLSEWCMHPQPGSRPNSQDVIKLLREVKSELVLLK